MEEEGWESGCYEGETDGGLRDVERGVLDAILQS